MKGSLSPQHRDQANSIFPSRSTGDEREAVRYPMRGVFSL